jgi:hypothetical protein
MPNAVSKMLASMIMVAAAWDDLHNKIIKALAALTVCLAANAAQAQPAQPQPKASAPVADLLASSPSIVLDNGTLRAVVRPPDLQKGFYRGTRFDQAGVITSLKAGSTEFYGPWFERTAPEVLDYTYVGGDLVAGPDSAISGPVEEFAPLGFQPKPGLFVKIGVGVLRQPDDLPYDHYRHYQIANPGRRQTISSSHSVTFTQKLSGAGYAYDYEKTITLVPGSNRMQIDHVLKNTGATPIDTTVYDHNFLRLVPGNSDIRVSFPFTIHADLAHAANPPPADLIGFQGNSLVYLRRMKNKERLSFSITGFGDTADDYDIRIDGPTGAAVRIKGNAPITKINIFSVDRVQAVEPYIAIHVPPGNEQRWRYTYEFTP